MRKFVLILAVLATVATAVTAFLCYQFYVETVALANYIKTMPARAARHANRNNGRAESVDEAQIVSDAHQQSQEPTNEKEH